MNTTTPLEDIAQISLSKEALAEKAQGRQGIFRWQGDCVGLFAVEGTSTSNPAVVDPIPSDNLKPLTRLPVPYIQVEAIRNSRQRTVYTGPSALGAMLTETQPAFTWPKGLLEDAVGEASSGQQERLRTLEPFLDDARRTHEALYGAPSRSRVETGTRPPSPAPERTDSLPQRSRSGPVWRDVPRPSLAGVVFAPPRVELGNPRAKKRKVTVDADGNVVDEADPSEVAGPCTGSSSVPKAIRLGHHENRSAARMCGAKCAERAFECTRHWDCNDCM